MGMRPKVKRNLDSRDEIRERMTLLVRLEQPTGRFVDLFRRMENKGHRNLGHPVECELSGCAIPDNE